MAWTVHPHGPLTELLPGVWTVDGTLPPSPLPRRMVVWRLPSGGLCVHSAVSLDEAGMTALDALGPVELILVPNSLHRADAPAWKQRYPRAKVIAPSASRTAVSRKVPVEATCEETLPALGVPCVLPPGVKPGELVYRVPLLDGGQALVTTDLIFHVRAHLPGVAGWVMRHLTQSTGFFGVSRLGRWLMVQDPRSLAAWLRDEAEDERLGGVIMAHGTPALADAREKLLSAAERLLG